MSKILEAIGREVAGTWQVAHITESAIQAAKLIEQSLLACVDMCRNKIAQPVTLLEVREGLSPSRTRTWKERIDGVGLIRRLAPQIVRDAEDLVSTRDRAVYRRASLTSKNAEESFGKRLKFLTACFSTRKSSGLRP